MNLASAIALLRAAYPRQDFPDTSVALYGAKLRVHDPQAVAEAIEALIDTSTFLPSIAEIKREVAERQLALPSVEEAWEIAERGSLRSAPPEVQAAAEYVGGRWAILNSTNPTALRSQFRSAYAGYRKRTIEAFTTNRPLPPIPELPGPTIASLPDSQRIRPRPVMARLAERWAGRALPPPTEEEKADAILVLKAGPPEPGEGYLDLLPGTILDPMYQEAERIFEEGAA